MVIFIAALWILFHFIITDWLFQRLSKSRSLADNWAWPSMRIKHTRLYYLLIPPPFFTFTQKWVTFLGIYWPLLLWHEKMAFSGAERRETHIVSHGFQCQQINVIVNVCLSHPTSVAMPPQTRQWHVCSCRACWPQKGQEMRCFIL